MNLPEIIPPLTIGTTFTTIALLKFYGLWKGIEGGAGKPFTTKLCGT